jgi:hypothetical protein
LTARGHHTTGNFASRANEWGCTGAQFSGVWHDVAAYAYVARMQAQLAGRVSARPGF